MGLFSTRDFSGAECLRPERQLQLASQKYSSKPQLKNCRLARFFTRCTGRLNRKVVAVSSHFEPAIEVLKAISSFGILLRVWGLIALSFWMNIFRVAVLILGKSWFFDQMVWLNDEMKDTHSE